MTRNAFDEITREVAGGADPILWNQLIVSNWKAKDGTHIDDEGALREYLVRRMNP